MATEEEAREAADGEEVQVEAVDLEPVHMQTHLNCKLSSMEIKNMGEIIDSTEGALKIPEDQVLVEAPSEVKLPLEHNLNGTASPLNGHMDEEEKMSNEELHENNKNGQEQVEAALDEESTDQRNKISKEGVNGCLSHGESTAEDSSILKYEKEEEPKGDDQQDLEGTTLDDTAVQEDQLKTGNAVAQTVDGPQDQGLEPTKATEDTQHAGMANIPDVEVVAEAPAVAQTPLEPNVDDFDAIPDVIDRNTEADEPANADVVHLDQTSLPEDTFVAEHTDEVVKVEDQHSKQADAKDAEVAQEDKPKCEETNLQEEMPESEHADESTIDAQEVLNQESSGETNGPVCEKIEETSQQSNVVASEETTTELDATSRDLAVNIQGQNQESIEEKEDAEAVGTEAAIQQSSFAFEEADPEDHVATTESISDIEDAKDEGITNKRNVAFTEPAVQEPTADIQPVQELEQTETKSTGTYEMDEASDQTHAVVFDDLAQEDATAAASEPQVTEIAQEMKDTEDTETEGITQQDHIASSKEFSTEDDSTASKPYNDDLQQALEQDSVEVKDTETAETHQEINYSTTEEDMVEDNVTEEGPTCGSQEGDNVKSAEEIKENIVENIVSNVLSVDEVDEEERGPRAEDIAEKHMRGPEETKSTESVETEKASDQRYAALFDDTPATKKQQMEPAVEIQETEATAMCENTPAEDHITESATTSDTQEVNITQASEAIKSDKDTKTGEISDQSNLFFAGESAQENNALESESTTDIQLAQEPEAEEMKNAEHVEENETYHKMDADVQKPTQEDNPTESELHAMASVGEVSSIEATEAEASPHQSNADQSEEQTEENVTASETPILESQSIEETNDIEATEPQSITHQSIISTSEKSIPEEIAAENNVTIEPDVGHQQLQNEKSVELKETEANKPQGIASSSIVSTPEEYTMETNVAIPEPSSDTQAENLQSAQVIEDTENVKSDAALDEEAVLKEHVQTEAPVDISPMQDPELEETKNTEPVEAEDNMTSRDLPAEEMDEETMESEAIPQENPVASINELVKDDILAASAPHGDIQPVLEQESVERTKCPDTTEYPEEPQQTTGSASDELTSTEEKTMATEPACDTQGQNVTAQEIKDSEDRKTDEISNISSFSTPEEAAEEAEESSSPRIEPTSDIKQEQELGSTEETRGIEAVEDHQKQKASTLEEVPIDSESNVDDQQVHENKPTEVKDTETMETEEVFKQSNITTPANAAEETSELGSEPDQPAQQVELSRDSEGSQLLKAEESSGQSNVLTLEERNVEDSIADEIDPPVDIKQEHELESVEEIKGINATEAEEDFRTSQPDAPTEPIQLLNDIEATKEMKGLEAINDGDISCEQTETATSEDPSPKDNETAPEDHHVESKEQNLGNEIDNAMLAHGTKDEIQTSAEQKDDAYDSGETAFTTQKSENKTDEHAVQTSGEDTLETLNNISQIKEEQNAGIEHNSSQMAEKPRGENITHVQDKDIKGELLTERGTAEASQAVFENDPQASQDVTDKDDTIKSDEQTRDDDNRQPGDVAPQPQTCESSMDDEAAQKVNLDEQEKEDDKIESQKEEFQADEQKHEDERDDVTMEPLVEPQNTENGTTNRTVDTDVFQAEQTEAVVTEILKNEQALHTSEESTTIIADTKVENIAGTDEGAEEENKPNNVSTLDADSKLDNKEQEITEKDDIVAKDPTDETIDEITNEELEPDLASSVQEISDPSPSNGQVLENDPIAVPQNVESGGHREDKECTNKVNDDVFAIQESEKEIVAEVEENKEMQNEDNAVRHDESHTEPEKDETSQLHSNEPCNAETKMDDTTTRCPEIIHDNTTIMPRETEEIGENKGFSSISFPPKEDNVEQDLSVHKVEYEEQTTTEQNAMTVESMQQVDSSNADVNNDDQASTSKSLPEHETESADDVMQLETEHNALDMIHETVSNEKTETSNTEATETKTTNEDFCDNAAGADGALSDESLKTFGTVENLDASSIVTALKEGNMNEKMEDHKLALPAHPTQDENTPEQGLCFEKTEREMSLSEKPVPIEPDNNRILEEQNEEDMHEPEIGDATKEVESYLPVSHFLMNLILGKENSDANGNSEPEAERKQEETRDDNSCLIISKQEESLVSLKVDDTLTFEEEIFFVKCSEETQVVKEPSHDLKLDTEGSLETDVELNKNSHGMEIPAYQEKSQDKISSELLSEEAAGLDTKMEARDIEFSNIELDDSAIDAICQENMEVTTQTENGSLKENLDDLTNTKASEEETLAEGQTGLSCESLPEDRSTDAESEQTHLLTESGLIAATSLPIEADSVENPVRAKQEETIESSNTGVTTTPEIQLGSEEVNKIGEKQHATTATGEVAEEHVETPHDNLQKSTISEATSDEQAPQITEPDSDTEITLTHEKDTPEGSSSTCMDEKVSSNFSIKEVENFQTAVELQADGPDMQTNQDKQDEAADNQTEMEPEKLGESNFQEHQENGTEQKCPKGNDEADQQFLGKKETAIKEADVHETVERHAQTAKMNSNEEHELFDSTVQERDFNVVSSKEAPEVEENFVDVTKPEFSTDDEQSPKDDKPNMADEKTKDEEETKNLTDEVKTEARGAGQKAAHKKYNLLSGVGSKVKHQLAKVKKAIVGKPGHTKPESPKEA